MKFEHVNSYAASPESVHAMLTQRAFREEVCTYQRALEHSVEITEDSVATRVVITQTQAMDGAPAAARKLVGSSVQIIQRETWQDSTTADFAMEIPGKPGHLRGTISVVDKDDGTCDEVFAGDVKVNVPLIGGKLEGFISDILARALRREGRVGVTWLEQHPDGV
jgi:glyoxylase-like metal-dependent hydrolase (beta-lactamase superfamily II)